MIAADTGYEGKFDFPRTAEAPRLTYMLATMPRTGSSWFSHLLWRTGCLGAPLEYLNYEPASPYFFAKQSTDWQLTLWRSVLTRRTSTNGVFGLKCFPVQLQQLQESNPQLLSEAMSALLSQSRPPLIVYLDRKDRAAHEISYARAIISGVWRSEQEDSGGTRVDYSPIALERARKLLDGQRQAWEQMFRDLSIEPLRLWYEDVLADPEAAVRAVADHLGVALDRKATVSVPEIRRQSQEDAAKWAERYRRSGD
jgi:LPS sulfotransferase NodH